MPIADRIIDIYEKHAHAFDQDRDRSLFEQFWLDAFIELIPPGGSVLDLGCGMAEPIAAYLLGRGLTVVGIDASPTMIGICAQRYPGPEWSVADMRQLELGRRFDGLLAWDSFFHLTPDEQRAMFPRFAAHANPGASLLFTTGPYAGEAIGTFQGEPLYHASLDAEEYRALLDCHGFDLHRQRADDPECGGHTVWLAQHRPPAGPSH